MIRIQDIKGICAATKSFYIYDVVDGEGVVHQWLGNKFALYPLEGLPLMECDHIVQLFALTAKQREKWMYRHYDPAETKEFGVSFKDCETTDKKLEIFDISINKRGEKVTPFRTEDGKVIFVNSDYLKPIWDDIDETIFLERRRMPTATRDGISYIAVCTGLLLSAIIMPKTMHTDTHFVEEMEELTSIVCCMRDSAGIRAPGGDMKGGEKE